jgi:hypothetical protein
VARILDISDIGLVSIVFDKSIVIRNKTEVDKSVLNITMVPNKDVNEETKQKLMKFEWKCIKFERNLV